MDDEDTIELTITKGFFKKSANYFVGVRMLGHAGKVKTELIEDTTAPSIIESQHGGAKIDQENWRKHTKKRRKGWKWEKKQRNTYSIQGFQTYAHTSKFSGRKCKNCVVGSVFAS